MPASNSRSLGTLPINSLQPGIFQPRQAITPESLEHLTASIKDNGVIQAIIVRRLASESDARVRYEIIAGERRWQAAKLAGLTEIPAVVREFSDKEALAIALIENIQREELSATDEARALKRLISEFSLTQQAVADSVGRSRAAVSNLMRLLELPAAVIQMIDSKVLGMGHARALLALENPHDQVKAAHMVASGELSVRDTEKLVRQLSTGQGGRATRKVTPAIVTQVLKTSAVDVELRQLPHGSGTIVIEFADPQSRDELLELLKSYDGN